MSSGGSFHAFGAGLCRLLWRCASPWRRSAGAPALMIMGCRPNSSAYFAALNAGSSPAVPYGGAARPQAYRRQPRPYRMTR